MQIYPAIDIKNGQCVRLTQGKFQDMAIYSDTPLKVAAKWQQQGATYIHIVDLDGALVGHSVNEDVIKSIAKEIKVPIQVGGGIRTLKDIENKLELGVARVIIGTKAVKEPNFIKTAIRQFGADKIVVGIDAKNGYVAIEGWEVVSKQNVIELCTHMKTLGVKAIVYTDITKDGMLSGPNIEQTKNLMDKVQIDVILSGGISSMKDLSEAQEIGVQGTIIGKALYENHVDLKHAINLFERRNK